MVTRGIIKRVVGPQRTQEKVSYDVWIPLLDGNNKSITHQAVYSALPHEETMFHSGDVVYVAMVDMEFDDLVILGMASKDSLPTEVGQSKMEASGRTSTETRTGLQINGVINLEFDSGGMFNAPSNTVLPETVQLKPQYSIKANRTQKLNLKSLTGLPEGTTLGTVVWEPKNGGLGFDYQTPPLTSGGSPIMGMSTAQYRQAAIDAENKRNDFRGHMGLLKSIIISASRFDALISQGKDLQENTVYYVYDDEED